MSPRQQVNITARLGLNNLRGYRHIEFAEAEFACNQAELPPALPITSLADSLAELEIE